MRSIHTRLLGLLIFASLGSTLLPSCAEEEKKTSASTNTNLSWSFANAGGTTALNKNTSRDTSYPDLAVFNSKLYATWVESSGTAFQVRMKESSSGTSWTFVDGDGTNGMNIDAAMVADKPTLLATASKIYLAWQEPDVNNGYSQIRVKESANGTVWTSIDGGAATGIGADPTNQNGFFPSMAYFNSKLYVAWYESNGTAEQARVKQYDGSSWTFVDGGGMNKVAAQMADGRPVLATFNSKLYVVWEEQSASGSKYQIRAKESSNGTAWSFIDGNGATGLNFDTSRNATSPHLAEFNSKLYAIWLEGTGTNGQVRVKSFDGSSWATADGGTALNADSTKDAVGPKLVVFNSKLYAVWRETNGTKYQIRVKVLNGSSFASADGGSATAGLNSSSSQDATVPAAVSFSSKLYVIWSEIITGSTGNIMIKAGN